MKLTLFTEELRECLNAAGLSDCGENDEWNYWYQRLLKAHSESVERRVMTEVAENDRLRELVRKMWPAYCWAQSGYEVYLTDEQDREIRKMARELGVEVDE